jgi:flagellar basal body-associated protein FliL
MIALEERVVNLQAGGAFRYAKIGVTVEIRPLDASFYTLVGEERAAADELARKEYEPMVPLLLDALGTVVSSRTSSDLVAVDGRARLKEELIGAMGVVLGEQAVLNVYFTDLVMQ